MITPHEATAFYTPDQIAECMEGITDSSYMDLWSTVEHLPKISQAQMEDGMTPSDYRQICAVSTVWDRLEESTQKNVNEVLQAEEDSWDLT